MRAIATDVTLPCLCAAKTVEPLEMPLGTDSRPSVRLSVTRRHMGATWRIRLNSQKRRQYRHHCYRKYYYRVGQKSRPLYL